MNAFSYNSDLNGGSLMVRESRIIADLLLKNATNDEWQRRIQVENELQKRTVATAKRFSRAIRSRLERLEPEFWQALRDGDDELASQVGFVSVLERNLLLLEFMERVVKDAYDSHSEVLKSYQWLDFLDDCGNKDPKIHDWKESTRKKMGSVVFHILSEAGYLENTRTKRIQNVLIRPEIKDMLNNTYRKRLLASMDIRL
ncbi:DUF1819 family protein [Oceanobacter sp. 5_MG-2023]|uniref:DUF1819 family protein n=1 Tax=Oceanobacter sp. 5_MG-2023 TaxID=3062645 RepID=UPI0026E1D90B|nr:DUF1819 family protein [Oceanobacter sp. 5_MG-2023]MDO6683747.1 DUF1819 family protein [Oceanobacter sp. 5_MG-2023]